MPGAARCAPRADRTGPAAARAAGRGPWPRGSTPGPPGARRRTTWSARSWPAPRRATSSAPVRTTGRTPVALAARDAAPGGDVPRAGWSCPRPATPCSRCRPRWRTRRPVRVRPCWLLPAAVDRGAKPLVAVPVVARAGGEGPDGGRHRPLAPGPRRPRPPRAAGPRHPLREARRALDAGLADAVGGLARLARADPSPRGARRGPAPALGRPTALPDLPPGHPGEAVRLLGDAGAAGRRPAPGRASTCRVPARGLDDDAVRREAAAAPRWPGWCGPPLAAAWSVRRGAAPPRGGRTPGPTPPRDRPARRRLGP